MHAQDPPAGSGPGDHLLRRQSRAAGGAPEGAEAGPEQQRELLIYAIPLTRERLVFLPVAGWTEEPKQAPAEGAAPVGAFCLYRDRGLK